MNYEYSVNIVWSQEDGAYVAVIGELPGCMADGQTQEEALQNIKQVAAEWIETAKATGRAVPDPMTLGDLEKAHQKFQKDVHQFIQNGVRSAVQQVLLQIAGQQQMLTRFGGEVVLEPQERGEFEIAGHLRHR